jgi:hypothetical protein
VKLWALHTPSYDLTKGRVDHDQSKYYCTVTGVKEAYAELWSRLDKPNGQMIWCDTDNSDIVKTGIEMILWELEVPADKIICFLDSLVWNRILGIQCGVSTTMRHQWIREGIERYPDDYRAYVDRCEQEFWARKPRNGSWWEELFVENPGDCVNALIDHPVPDSYVINKIKWWSS